ncbi:MAG: 4-hydroxy-tetrahydrodipicolinate reductase, partial [Halolamina sp.]
GYVSAEAAVGTHLDAALADEERIDCVVDFTAPEATAEYAGICADYGVPFVTGTTGLDGHEADPLGALDAASETVPVLHASNFSRGVAALRGAVRQAAASLPDYDVEVTETHHNGKRDAPSGTALTLVADVADERPDLTERQHGRKGETPRADDEIGVHARRAGDVTGEHEVLFAGNGETLSLSHRAGDRSVFAEGALDAAAELAGRDPGRYRFADLL